MDIQTLSDNELIQLYGESISELKERGIIRSGNVIGDLGEYYAIQYYCQTKNLPKLQFAPKGTKNVDALSIAGERYSIKTTTGTVTGVFYGLNPPHSTEPEQQKFEYVIVVILDEKLAPKRINELSWEQFLHYKKWHSRMRAWNISVSKEMLSNSKTIYHHP